MAHSILDDIESYAALHRIAPATLTSRAVGNSRLYDRLKAGGSCTLATAERLRRYMAENPPRSVADDPAEDAA